MGYWSRNWDKPWRDVKRFGEDVYNRANSWYGRNKKYLPTNEAAYGVGGFGYGIRTGVKYANEQFNRKWDESNGGDRFLLSMAPLFGWSKMLEGGYNFFEDYYRNTGQNPLYPQVYNSFGASGLASQIGGQVGKVSPKRWARDIENMFEPQYEEAIGMNGAPYGRLNRWNSV